MAFEPRIPAAENSYASLFPLAIGRDNLMRKKKGIYQILIRKFKLFLKIIIF
jgi:hypothetical protein